MDAYAHSQPSSHSLEAYSLMPALFIEDSRYNGSQLTQWNRSSLPIDGEGVVSVGPNEAWKADFKWKDAASKGVRTLHAEFKCGKELVRAGAVGLAFDFASWSPNFYVILPGAVYAGNRFEVRPQPYSPRLEPQDAGAEITTIITDVPRLGSATGYPGLQLLAGDLAVPAVGIFDQEGKSGWWCFAEPSSARGGLGISIQESAAFSTATVRFGTPGVREQFRYLHCKTRHPSTDTGHNFKPEEVVSMKFTVWNERCDDLPAFLDQFLTMRRCAGNRTPPLTLPFSAARGMVETHYNRDNWRETGFYATDSAPEATYPFQTGWCGGGIASSALLQSRDELTRARAIRTSHHLFANGVSSSGFFWGKGFNDGTWGSDFCRDSRRPYLHDRTLIRRHADALYFGLKQLDQLGSTAPTEWTYSLKGCADAFVRLWRRYNQFGQFVHQTNGELLIGNSTCAALAPGALALAAKHFDQPEYLAVAEAAGRQFYERFVLRGFTTGGPGDALQNPDSESCAALLESYMELHTSTGAEEWIEAAKATASLFSTWVMPYDYDFPSESEFGRLDLKTTGTVFANAQNKHSAPGICTGSGVGLLKLYRATRDFRYMDLLAEIARALPQFVSREDRPIHTPDGRALPSGWINERVNTSDWDDNVGGVFYASTWCEVALLLTTSELPGVYVDLRTRRLWALDHVTAELRGDSLAVSNPTAFRACLRVVLDSDATAELEIDLAAGESREISLRNLRHSTA